MASLLGPGGPKCWPASQNCKRRGVCLDELCRLCDMRRMASRISTPSAHVANVRVPARCGKQGAG
jgi:hypothetical protein